VVYDALIEPVTEASGGTGAVIVAASGVENVAPAEPGVLPAADATALLQHSSGTTGLKKGVMLSYRAITAQLAAYRQALSLSPQTQIRVASWLPLYHDMGLISSFLLPVWHGAPILSVDPFEWTRDPLLLFEAIQNFRGTHAWVPNFSLLHQVRSARGNRRYDLGSLQALIGCSEPNKPEAFDAFTARFADWGIAGSTLQTCYAMAETVFAAAQSHIGVKTRRLAVDREALQTLGEALPPTGAAEQTVLLSNGPPIPGCDIRILKDCVFVGEKRVGEICISAPYLFTGYHNNTEATDKAFLDGYLRTGDLGFLEGGEVFIVGRVKDIIIVNGKNIVAHDVEAAISRVQDVKPGRAVAFGRYVEQVGSEQLVVVAERLGAEADDAATIRAISNAVSEEVGVGCSDVRMVEQGWLIKTTSGKISRSDNVFKYVERFASGQGL
jgi:acyl-CoA synthetase (AMP-forming)/AMP-acid ligase II